jgi:hypothetical protein
MPSDSEPLFVGRGAPDDLTSMLLDICSHVQFKFLGLLLVMFILISSDVFINRALAKFKNAVDYKCPTSWGVCLQGMFLVMLMSVIDALIRQKVI